MAISEKWEIKVIDRVIDWTSVQRKQEWVIKLLGKDQDTKIFLTLGHCV